MLDMWMGGGSSTTTNYIDYIDVQVRLSRFSQGIYIEPIAKTVALGDINTTLLTNKG